MTKNIFLHSKSTVYLNGKFVPFEKANLSIASASMQYGLSVYTALNVVSTDDGLCGFRLQDHYDRLCNSAKVLGMIPFSDYMSFTDFKNTISGLLAKNTITESVIVRTNYFIDEIMAGTKIHGLNTGASMFLLPFGDYFQKQELDVCVSSWTRIPDNALPPRAKVTGSYVNSSLMKSEAMLNGYDDCIALDQHGHVAEGAVANIFMVRNGILITPSESSDILEGITRNTVLRIAVELGIPTQIRTIDRSELYIADELFFSGSSARVWPIVSVDKRRIGDGKRGTITAQIQEAYSEVQSGKATIVRDWLTKLK